MTIHESAHIARKDPDFTVSRLAAFFTEKSFRQPQAVKTQAMQRFAALSQEERAVYEQPTIGTGMTPQEVQDYCINALQLAMFVEEIELTRALDAQLSAPNEDIPLWDETLD